MVNKPPLCNVKIANQPVCLPTNETIWYKNTWNFVSWDIKSPYYIKYNKLNLYFYYQENYKFYKTVSFNNIGANNGFYSLLVNDRFFPICEENKNWNYSVLLVGEGVDPDNEISSMIPTWHRIDFNVIQNGTCSDVINNSTINNNNTSNSSVIQDVTNPSNTKIDTWKIIVIVICLLLIIIISIILIRLIYIKKIIIKNNKKLNKTESNIITIDIKENMYQKPGIKEQIKDSNYNKPNEIINYEKPNCY